MPDPPDTQGQGQGEVPTNIQGFLAVRHTFLTYIEATPELRTSRSETDLTSLHAGRSVDSSLSSPRPGSSRGTIEKFEASSDSYDSSRSDDTGSLAYTRSDDTGSLAYTMATPESDAFSSGGAATTVGSNDLWSKGSAKHATGRCRPCVYVHTTAGCVRGSSCTFCHLEHPQRPRQRPCKATRAHLKRLAGMLESTNGFERVVAEDLTQRFARQHHSYMKNVLKAHANTKNSGSSSSGSSFGDGSERDRRNHSGKQSGYGGQEDPCRSNDNQSTSSSGYGQGDPHQEHGDYTGHHAIPPPLQALLATTRRPTTIRL